ncbi:LAGLIDADG family homing endonuclease [Nocardia sp. NBC_00511]|uniref:LAGLIDADG family homing endonuclease n=1 Tax=Nocardia sp. NBC_00511 TaxID=2903591 RepID=UPI0030E593E7
MLADRSFEESDRESDNAFEVRELGGIAESARVLRADNGVPVSLKALVDSGERPSVWSLDGRMAFVARPVDRIIPLGRTDVVRVRLASGRSIEIAGTAGLRTLDGWRRVRTLAVDDRIAIPRWIPETLQATELPDAEVILLAHMIGDGSCVKRQPIRYASIDEENLAAVTNAATHFGVTAVRDDYAAARVTTLRLPAPYHLTHGRRNPIAAWLDELGLFGLRSYEKFVPAAIFTLPTEQVALFLRHLWATDGSVRWDERGRQARIYYASTSLRLIEDVTVLLLRLGVHGRLKRVQKPGYRDCWHLVVDGGENQTTFLEDVGVHGARGRSAEAALAQLDTMTTNTNVDTVPREVWNRAQQLLPTRGMTHRQFQAAMGTKYCGSAMWKSSPSRLRLARAAEILDAADLAMLCLDDIFWDRITEITLLGEQVVFAASPDGSNGLVAQGIAVRTSL